VTPRISFIVSAYNRPEFLRCCLASLVCQTMTNWEAIVMDNTSDPYITWRQANISMSMNRVHYRSTPKELRNTSYHSSEWAVQNFAQGEWVAFPSDDSYYLPEYAQEMLAAGENADLVYCNMVMGGTWAGQVLDVRPTEGYIDKTGFILRREKFQPFPGKPDNGGPSNSDGMLIDKLVREGIRHVKVPKILAVHN
jgi:glycosyltransferase involved in cell wall biosynthesis